MPADEPALVAGIRERFKPAFEGLERGVTVEKNPLSVPAHWALSIIVCNCLAHTPSVVSPVTSKLCAAKVSGGRTA